MPDIQQVFSELVCRKGINETDTDSGCVERVELQEQILVEWSHSVKGLDIQREEPRFAVEKKEGVTQISEKGNNMMQNRILEDLLLCHHSGWRATSESLWS